MKIGDHMMGRVRLQGSYQRTFSEPDGQKVLNHLMKVAHVTRPMFDKDDKVLAYRTGQRDLVLQILSFVHKDPGALIKEIEGTLIESET